MVNDGLAPIGDHRPAVVNREETMRMRFRLAGVLTLLATCLVAFAMPADAQRRGGGFGPGADQWVKLGDQTVGFGVDRDVIRLGRDDGRFKAIKLIVKRNDIFLADLKVTFRSGESQDLAVRQQIRAGGETGTLALAPSPRGANGRVIERIDMVYRSRPGFRGEAIVEVWGIRAAEGPGGPGFAGPPPQRVLGGEIPRGWVLFGSQTVGFQTERDVIRVGREGGRFDKIALRVLRNDILLRELVVNYARGDSDRIPVNAEISANGVTQPIKMKREGRIENIQLVYQARPGFRGQAVVEVYGEYADSWLGVGGDKGRPTGQWLLLGAQRAELLKVDTDVFHVGKRLGTFKKVKVRAVGHGLELFGMRVTYGNGETEDVPVRANLRPGQETPPLDLRGRERFIEQVEMRYKTQLNLGGNATVELYGLH